MTSSLAPLTWRETRQRLRCDHDRLLQVLATQRPGAPRSAWTHPSFLCVAMYRLSNHLVRRGHGWLARLVWHLNLLASGADVSYLADLGPGLVLLHPAGTSVMGRSGRNLTLVACGGLGGEVGRFDDIAGWPGVPQLGDDVWIGPHAGVLGPVRIGHRVTLGAGVVVVDDVADDTEVQGPTPKLLRREPASTP